MANVKIAKLMANSTASTRGLDPEGTNFSRHLKQFDGLSWLTLTSIFYDRCTPLASVKSGHWSKALIVVIWHCFFIPSTFWTEK